MDERDPTYMVIQRGKVIFEERYLGAAVDRAWREAESRPNQPVEVRLRGEALAIYWRVVNR